MKVRAALRSDVPSILEIYNDAVLHTAASYDDEPVSLEQRLRWFEQHQEKNYPVLVVEENDLICGWGSLSPYHSRCGFRFTAEDSVYVAASHRGRGIGTLLLSPLIEAAKRAGLHALIGAIDAENHPSIRLHQRFGFLQVGLFREVGFKFGKWRDVIYLELLL